MGGNSRLKKVLIIAYYWGTRVPGLAKYLPEFGWQPIVLTAPLPEKPDTQFRIIETSYRDALGFWKRLLRLNPDENIRSQVGDKFGLTLQKSLMDFILTRAGEIFNYPDSDRGWKPFAVTAGSEFLQREDIHAILSSSSPVTSHLIAKELKAEYKIPWVADFRDLWSQNHNYSYSPIRKLFDTRLELKTLRTADALVTVSQLWADKLSALHKGKTTYAITNGFDPAEVNNPPAALTTKFTITYTGAIYAKKQDPAKLFAALRDLISDETIDPRDVEVRFYGYRHDWVNKEITQYGLLNIVKQHGLVPRQSALEKQRESQLLLLLDWDDPQEKGVYPLKIFEYLGTRRPILTTGGSDDDVVARLLNETKAGICAPTVEDIKNTIGDLYREYKMKSEIAYKGEKSKANKYSHREMARKFSEILDHLTQK